LRGVDRNHSAMQAFASTNDGATIMSHSRTNRIAVMLNNAFADWETGYLTASARDFFSADVKYYSPHGGEVTSEGGLMVLPAGSFDAIESSNIDALIVCGSARWSADEAIDISEKLRSAIDHSTIVGVICAGTLTAARAGLFEDRLHTSNGLDWLKQHIANYQAAAHYQDVNDAIVDRGVVSAPGSAPVAFACAVLGLLYKDHASLPQVLSMLKQSR
jgi:putative intracellular protease/amidase